MNTKTIAMKIAFVTVGAAATAAAVSGTASAEVPEDSYYATFYPLYPPVWFPVSADAAVSGDTLTIAGLSAPITPTADGGIATIAGQRLVLAQGPGPTDYTIYDEGGAMLGWIFTR